MAAPKRTKPKKSKPTKQKKSTRSTKHATSKIPEHKWLVQPAEHVYFRIPVGEGADLTPEVLESLRTLSKEMAHQDAIAPNARCGAFLESVSPRAAAKLLQTLATQNLALGLTNLRAAAGLPDDSNAGVSLQYLGRAPIVPLCLQRH
jgi:hypothetical protein